MNILLTGSTGFIGSRLAERLYSMPAANLTMTVRHSTEVPYDCSVYLKDSDPNTDWSDALSSQHVIIHSAACSHVIKGDASDLLAEYRRVNVDGTLNLARQAAALGVGRFIFISSINVNGCRTSLGQFFTEDDVPSPNDVVGISRLEAEQGLQLLASEVGIEVVIIRSPLVYGPNSKGNFASLIKLVENGWPLPLGSLHNRRSLVAVDNLVDLIIRCIDHPAAANQVFLAGDGQDLSTTKLLQGVAKAMGKPSRLFPVPESLLILTATVLGKRAVAQRLLGSLSVDISKARDLLGWEPPITVEEGLRRCFVSQDKY